MVIGIFFFIIALIIPIIIIALIVGAFMKNSKNDDPKKSEADFAKTIRGIYTYLILICLLFTIIGATVWLFSSAVNHFIPLEDTSYSWHNSPARERNTAIVSMSTATSMLIVSVPLFLYHNKIARDEKTK